MESNYLIIGLIILISIVIIIILIRRNKKDQHDFENTVNESEIEPEKHKDVEPL